MLYFEQLRELNKHDIKKYGPVAAAVLDRIMLEEINGYCFKYPPKKAAALVNLNEKQFKGIIDFLAAVGACCVAGNAIVTNPHRTRLKKLKNLK